jgi:glycosyltransferase involved in cell wall biosynthesis
MKILQISNYYYPHIGGIEQVAHDCADSFKERYEQKLICFNSQKGDTAEVVDGVEIIRAGSFAKVASQSLSISYRKLLKHTIKQFAPDVVIFHYPNPFEAAALIRSLRKHKEIKLVLYWHLDITKQKLLGKLFNGQTKWLLKRAAKVIATSPNYVEGSKYLSQYRDKCTVIPNCVGRKRLSTHVDCRDIKEKYKGKIICFALGRHVEYKGMEYLVRAAKYLDDRYVVLIGGQGPLTPELKKLASGDDKVEFLGRISDEDVDRYIAACDIFCFPSITKNEAFGIALAEAMACGKPCVTFTIEGSGVNYVCPDRQCGIEVENCNSRAFAAAICELGESQTLRDTYGKNARSRVEMLFTFASFKKNILNTIEGL